MTREEAFAEVRSIDRRCRGPQFPVIEARAVARARVPLRDAMIARGARADDAVDQVDQLVGRKTSEVIAELIATGQREAAAALDGATRYRKAQSEASGGVELVQGCGADINDLILAQDLDGEEHEASCPKCGRIVRWRAPLYEVTE